jgi:hypothetical protein
MKPAATKSDLNLVLKLAIIATRRPQGEFARRARIGEVRFSKIVTGRIPPTDDERERIAKLLQKDRAELQNAFTQALEAIAS